MDNCLKLQKYSDKLFTQADIKIPSKDRYKVVKQVALYIDSLIFNTVSLFCLIAIINNSTKITDQTITAAHKLTSMKCIPGTQSGGRLGCATYLGMAEPMYSDRNPSNDILTVDFNGGVARPQIGGGVTEMDKLIAKYITKIMAYHKVTASTNIKQHISKIVNDRINCFYSSVLSHKGSLTINAVERIIKKNKKMT